MTISRKIQQSLGLPLLNELFDTEELERMVEPDYEKNHKISSTIDTDILDDDDDDNFDDDDYTPEERKNNSISNKMVNAIMPQIMVTDNNQLQHEQEMDEFSEKVEAKADDLIELAYSVDPKAAGAILGAATKMLQLSLDAKKNKRSTQLEIAKLQLEAIKLERTTTQAQPNNIPEVGNIPANARILSREEMMKKLK